MARKAVGLAPENAFPQYALAKVQSARSDERGAMEAIDEAIRIDPDDADYRALKSAFLYDRQKWRESLEFAEKGLALDPNNTGCQNLRGMSLVKLGRRKEAESGLLQTLRQEPENPHAHAALGWSLLESGDVDGALEHFGEALRLDPDKEWARQGLVAALKARYVVYRWVLSYFLWMSRHPKPVRIGILLGVWMATKVLMGLAAQFPALLPIAVPFAALWFLFLIATWVSDPIFNLLLLLHPKGRHALKAVQRRTAILVGCTLIAATLVGIVAALGARGAGLVAGAGVAFLILPISAVATCAPGKGRTFLAIWAALVAAFVLVAVEQTLFPGALWNREDGAFAALGAGLLGGVASTWMARFVRARARRS
jgi:hypothetical protein